MAVVKIIPNEANEDGPTKTQGTEFRCGDEKLYGVYDAVVRFAVDDVVRADISLHGWMQPVDGAEARFFIRHPFTGEPVPVDEMQLANGDKLNLRPETDVTDLCSTAREYMPGKITVKPVNE